MKFSKGSVDSFWSKVGVTAKKSDCWPWLGARKPSGYGNATVDKKYYSAHRLCWEIVNFEIPEGFVVMHICDNPSCCNPNHLALSRPFANNLDKIIKNRSNNYKNKAVGERNANSKLTVRKVAEIRELYDKKEFNQYELAELYGVSQVNIGCIVRNETWRNL